MIVLKKWFLNDGAKILKSFAIMVSKLKTFHNHGTKNFKIGSSVIVLKKFHNNMVSKLKKFHNDGTKEFKKVPY